jgi:HNH endonuclease
VTRRSESEDPFVWLPCLRCGQLSVPIPTMFLRTDGSGSTWNCRARPCESEHYLSVDRREGAFVIAYRRYTLRYPLEFYDEGVAPYDVRLFLREPRDSRSEEDGFSGPVIVYPRKKRFSTAEVKSIWEASQRRCHICKRRWALNQRGVRGWHIDHVIPHIGGGGDTEGDPNFRVACANCNLKKGKGFKETAVRCALGELVRSLTEGPVPGPLRPPRKG